MIVPSFDNPSSEGRKLAIICSKGNLDMAYPGLILANAALGEGVETHLFFTFWGFDMINKATMGDLKFSFVGNTAMHPPGHSGVGIHHMLGALPGATAAATTMLKKQIAEQDVPEVPEFLELLVGLRRPPVGLPDVGGHEPPDDGRPLRGGRGDHLRERLHRAHRGRPAALHLTDRPGRPDNAAGPVPDAGSRVLRRRPASAHPGRRSAGGRGEVERGERATRTVTEYGWSCHGDASASSTAPAWLGLLASSNPLVSSTTSHRPCRGTPTRTHALSSPL